MKKQRKYGWWMGGKLGVPLFCVLSCWRGFELLLYTVLQCFFPFSPPSPALFPCSSPSFSHFFPQASSLLPLSFLLDCFCLAVFSSFVFAVYFFFPIKHKLKNPQFHDPDNQFLKMIVIVAFPLAYGYKKPVRSRYSNKREIISLPVR